MDGDQGSGRRESIRERNDSDLDVVIISVKTTFIPYRCCSEQGGRFVTFEEDASLGVDLPHHRFTT
jgi:hypothetical protein